MTQTPAPVIATHNGAFHADDAFGVAVLLALHPNAALIRTRDAEQVAAADFAVDVGGCHAPAAGRFDHHQKGFDTRRASGVLYASAGLVWDAHGRDLVRQLAPTLDAAEVQSVWQSVDDELVQHLDMADTGAAQGAAGYFGLSALIDAYNTSRSEDAQAPDAPALALLKRQQFLAAVDLVQTILQRLVLRYADELQGAQLVRTAQTAADGRILVLPEPGLSWSKVVCAEMPDVRFVVYPDSTDRQYQIRTVPVEPESFQARQDLPRAWAGLRGSDLAAVTGVADAVFCHNACFIGGAGSLQGALALAHLAL